MVIGRDKVCWCLKDGFGKDTILETWSCHVPTSDIRIFSPQSYFQREKKNSKISVDENFVGFYGLIGTPHICVPYHKAKNLRMLFGFLVRALRQS